MTYDTRIRVYIDAAGDLSAAGYDRAEALSLLAAWTAALARIASDVGLTDCEGTTDESRSTRHMGRGDDAEPVETLLWQAAHDAVERSRAARSKPGTWCVAAGLPRRSIASIRRAIGLTAPALQ